MSCLVTKEKDSTYVSGDKFDKLHRKNEVTYYSISKESERFDNDGIAIYSEDRDSMQYVGINKCLGQLLKQYYRYNYTGGMVSEELEEMFD